MTAAVNIVSVAETLRVALNLMMLVQQAHTSGEPITQEQFDNAVRDRNAALAKLDHDIAARRASDANEVAPSQVVGTAMSSGQPRNG